jgi:hypothetical protein
MKNLIGKTIVAVKLKKHLDSCDSVNVLLLTMTDGSVFEIAGGYGGYTGNSCDEYVETISIKQIK